MIQEIGAGRFQNQFRQCSPRSGDYVIAFSGKEKRDAAVLVEAGQSAIVYPTVGQLKEHAQVNEEDLCYLFSLDEDAFYLWKNWDEMPNASEEWEYRSIRMFRTAEPMELCFAGMTAYHLYVWYRNNRYCGYCGAQNEFGQKERTMVCPSCGHLHFPKICPAVIVAVRNGDSLMTSRYAGREYKGVALLAGFCEIGETPEETVAREVREEVGIRVKNITYFGSQPWGYDRNLLLGYYCDLDGNADIMIDRQELETAGWVKRTDIAENKNLRSLTATMIEAFRRGEI